MQRFIKRGLSLIMTFFLLGSSLALAADLNAPAEKKVTIGSELYRGGSAIFETSLNIKATNLLGKLQAFDAVFNRSRQANKDTQAFLLGASLVAWTDLDITLEMAAQNPSSIFYPPKEVQLVENAAKIYFKDVRKIQKELNIDDKTLTEACHLKYDLLKANFYRWDKKIK